MKICLGCNRKSGDDRQWYGIDYILCDSCRDNAMGDLTESEILKKATLIFENGMKWDDVLNFIDLTMMGSEDYILLFKRFGIERDVVVELYESWEGSNDGC